MSQPPSIPPTGAPTLEGAIKRNPHPDFTKVQASRAAFDKSTTFTFTQTSKPDWKLGDGGNDDGESLKHEHREIDPYEEGRSAVLNYKLLISGIIPRPIGFVSTRSEDGTTTNLAPYSFFNVLSADPPIFVLSFTSSPALPRKDSLANLLATRECTINIISEHYVEAANASSINAPYGVSEWSLSGLHPAPSSVVKPDRVKEAIFSVEGKLVETREFTSRQKGKEGVVSSVVALVEGVNFWAREDAVDDDGALIDPKVLRPVSRLGGIGFGRLSEGWELLRPVYEEMVGGDEEAQKLVKQKVDGQGRL